MNNNKKLQVKRFDSKTKQSYDHLIDFVISNNIKREDILFINDSLDGFNLTILYYYA